MLNANSYIEQIKVIDTCVKLTEPLKIDSLGLKGISASMIDIKKSRIACQKSLQQHPKDPHIKFLLARAYSMGATTIPQGIFPQKKILQIKELNGILPDHSKAFTLAQESCQMGDIGGCMLLGYYYYTGKYPRKDMKKAYLLWLWSCTKGNPHACQNLSEMIDEHKHYVPKNATEATKYSLQACLSGLYPRACVVLSDKWFHIKKPFKNDKRLKQYIDFHACVYGDHNACYFLFKDDNKTSIDKKLYAFKYACNNRNANACTSAGIIYMENRDNLTNRVMAENLFEIACQLGDIYAGCWYAGAFKMNASLSIHQNIPLGITYLTKSCFVGKNSFACYDLATFYLKTKNKKYQNREKALPILERSCTLGNFHAVSLGCKEGISSCCEKSSLKNTQRDKL